MVLDINTTLRIVDIFQELFDYGYAHLDGHYGNFLFPEDGSIKLINFDYSHKYPDKPNSFSESYDIAGPSRELANNHLPIFSPAEGLSWSNYWYPRTGLTFDDIANRRYADLKRTRDEYARKKTLNVKLARIGKIFYEKPKNSLKHFLQSIRVD